MKKSQAWLLCFISALALGFAQPFYVPFMGEGIGSFQYWLGALVLLGYVPLWLALARQNLKNTFLMSFVTLTLQYTVILYWIYIACHDYGDVSVAMSALITILLPMEVALVGALFFTWGQFLARKLSISFFYLAPFVLCAMEYARNYVPFGGFPWGNSGYSAARIPEFLQLASLVGIYGVVFWVGLVNAFVCIRKAWLSLVLIILVYIFGAMRLSNSQEYGSFVRVALLQGNIPQDMKNKSRMYSQDILRIYLELQEEALKQNAELIVWPEAAYPRSLDKNIKELPFESPLASVMGSTVYGYDSDEEAHFHNSAFIQNYEGKVISRYDKSHLVPFGEYVPWPFVGIVNKIVPGMGAYRPGIDFSPIELAISPAKKFNIGTTVCYEGIFPEISRAYAQKDTALMVNITNDAWYGESSAPFQHLLMYQLRSVESGRPYARATNSGISALIDPYGRIKKQTSLFTREILVDDIKIINKKTLYTRLGDVLPMVSILVLFILTGLFIYQRMRVIGSKL